jgi:hypothetical protein
MNYFTNKFFYEGVTCPIWLAVVLGALSIIMVAFMVYTIIKVNKN